MDSIIEVFYHLNKMLIATEHTADNNFVFQQNSALTHLYANATQSKPLDFTFSDLSPNSPAVIGEPH